MNKVFIVVMLCLLCLFIKVDFSKCDQENKLVVEYYYVNYCESCNVDSDFTSRFESLTGSPISQYEYHSYNVAQEAGYLAYNTMISHYNLSEQQTKLPIVIVDGHIYAGTYAIENELPAYSMSQSGDNQSILYYLYQSACDSCNAVSKMLNALPQTVQVKRGEYIFDSPVHIIRVDIGTQPVLAKALFDAYDVPINDQMVPIILTGSTYYKGEKVIDSLLRFGLSMGRGLDSPTIQLVDEANLSIQSQLYSAISSKVASNALIHIISFLLYVFITVFLITYYNIKWIHIWSLLKLCCVIEVYFLYSAYFISMPQPLSIILFLLFIAFILQHSNYSFIETDKANTLT